jgi:hypothetical protein
MYLVYYVYVKADVEMQQRTETVQGFTQEDDWSPSLESPHQSSYALCSNMNRSSVPIIRESRRW